MITPPAKTNSKRSVSQAQSSLAPAGPPPYFSLHAVNALLNLTELNAASCELIGTRFCGETSFQASRIRHVNFLEARFDSYVDFDHACFEEAVFQESLFYGRARFTFTQFASFDGESPSFGQNATFEYAKFYRSADFDCSQFGIESAPLREDALPSAKYGIKAFESGGVTFSKVKFFDSSELAFSELESERRESDRGVLIPPLPLG
ncbi:pentapeptide repeat-containing protein [Saccharopolyspora mangrovi]|uniref:Pentapeptide repeat-containing protein n=1 Tax=Saccharopolyspora mangrovi TaxID=3082379 RepID=A0ABU6ADC0_9PSEU|nr:pentapeptide repeat-containing protein [Saccharopolyspora sp. S2-29]MEB3369515.1 pentapeptide repeat-containing protein [Saccharopolyspora sp. S2-29]